MSRVVKSRLYILAGGKSKRMGRDKALLKVGGITLLEYQINRFQPYFDEVVVLCGQNKYEVENRQIPDPYPDAGPLSGLLAAMRDSSPEYDCISVLAVDLPFFQISGMMKLNKKKSDYDLSAVIAATGQTIQPLAGVYSTKLLKKLELFLEKGGRKVSDFSLQNDAKTVIFSEKELVNLNSPQQKLLLNQIDRNNT